MDDISRLILLCLRAENGQSVMPEINEIIAKRDIGWSRLVWESDRHRVIPIVVKSLGNVISSSNSRFILARDELGRKLRANTVRNLFLVSELERAWNLLDENGIQTLAFKGPALAQLAYGDVSMRQFDDLDLLVAGNDIMKAMKLLMDKGYQPKVALSQVERRMHIREGWGCSFSGPGGGYYLELDSSVVSRNYVFDLNLFELNERAVNVVIDGKRFKSPCVEDQIHILCVHGGKHLWERWLWLSDLDGLIRRHHGLDWSVITTRAEKTGTMRLLLLGLFLAGKYIGTKIPQEIRRRIEKDPVVNELAEYAVDYMEGISSSFDGWKKTIPFVLKSRERAGDRVRCLCRFLFRPSYSDWKTFKLPQYLFFLYYPLRPLRILFRISR